MSQAGQKPNSTVGSQKSRMTDSRRARLLEIQKREQLKGMLINKFKLKYGNKPTISKYIDNEVQKFLAVDRLTEDKLIQLDDKIGREADNRDRKSQILQDRRSERAYSQVSGKRSQLSASNLSKLDAANGQLRPGSQVGSIRSRSQFKSSIRGSRPATGKYLNY